MNKTFIMLKPDAMKRGLEQEIIKHFTDDGMTIEKSNHVLVNEELILNHYKEVIEKVVIVGFKERLLREFVGETVAIYVLSGTEGIIERVRELVGPTEPVKADKHTIRGKYSQDSYALAADEDRPVRNLIHASDSPESVIKETSLWFD